MIGASVTVEDEDGFWGDYDSVLSAVFQNHGAQRRKHIYKAAHLTKQFLHTTPVIISEMLQGLATAITQIDVYSAYYNQPYVSCYGEGRGLRLPPVIFIEKNQNAFPHVCAWRYLDAYPAASGATLQLDHFEGKITPAWRLLEASSPRLQVFYSGSECTASIAVADIVLRLIESFQHGIVDQRSLFLPITNRVPQLTSKLQFHNMGGNPVYQRATAPVLEVDIDKGRWIKHPVYYMISKRFHDKAIQPVMEWGKFYNKTLQEATRRKGGVKLYNPDKDFLNWDTSADFVVPDQQADRGTLKRIKEAGIDTPPVWRPRP